MSGKAKDLRIKLAEATKAAVSPPGHPMEPVAAGTPIPIKRAKGMQVLLLLALLVLSLSNSLLSGG